MGKRAISFGGHGKGPVLSRNLLRFAKIPLSPTPPSLVQRGRWCVKPADMPRVSKISPTAYRVLPAPVPSGPGQRSCIIATP